MNKPIAIEVGSNRLPIDSLMRADARLQDLTLAVESALSAVLRLLESRHVGRIRE